MKSDKQDVGITCLNCGQVTVPPNKSQLDNWNCGYCYSGFLSLTMLNNLAPRELVRQLDKRGKQAATTGRPCSVCARQMELIAAVHNAKIIEVEVCRKCRLVWFDSGDLMRALRHREEEKILSDEELELLDERSGPKPAPPRKPELAPIDDTTLLPSRAYAIIALCVLGMPLAMRYPSFVTKYGFLPAAPFRMYGLTFLTSLFLHDSLTVLLGSMAVLFLVGGWVEHTLGPHRFLRLYFLSGIAGRLVHLLSGGAPDVAVIGASGAVCGVFAYTVLTFPYLKVLFPQTHRYKSPATAVAWWTVGIVTALGLYLGFNFFAVAVRSVANGSEAPLHAGTMFAFLYEFGNSAAFRAHLGGAAGGVLYYMLAGAPAPKRQGR